MVIAPLVETVLLILMRLVIMVLTWLVLEIVLLAFILLLLLGVDVSLAETEGVMSLKTKMVWRLVVRLAMLANLVVWMIALLVRMVGLLFLMPLVPANLIVGPVATI